MTRDEKGRFAKGNGGGPGRAKKPKEERYYEILTSTVTKDDWREIIKRAIYDAKKGDTSARTWLSNYIMGPAKQSIDITGGLVITWEDNGDKD